MNPIIFLRTAWMINYKGVTKNDVPNGAGSYVKDNHDGGEVSNFLPIDAKYYGYARIKDGNNLCIQRLGASSTDEYIDNVTVVFFATNPHVGGQYVIGWYDNARLFRSVHHLTLKNARMGHPYYLTVTSKAKATLLPIDLRRLEIPGDGPGQNNAWYVSEYGQAISFLKKFFIFKQDPRSYKATIIGTNRVGAGWQLDAEKRKNIEVAAMDATANYFQEKGFVVKYVHLDKVGWDLEARKNNTHLLLEVKGSSLALASIILTPNEYYHSCKKGNYRICILEHALDKSKAILHICKRSLSGKFWISELGDQMKIAEIRSAQLIKKSIED